MTSSTNCYSSLYPFPIDLNEDDQHQQHELFSLKSQPSAASSSSSSLTCPIFYNPSTLQEQAAAAGYIYQREPQQYFQDQEDQAKTYVPQNHGVLPLERDSTSGLKFSIWRKEERVESHDHENTSSASKWMSSKKGKVMMNNSDHADLSSSTLKFGDQKLQPSSPLDNSSNSCYNNNNNNNNNTVRVCADCNTTKTPLWRSGPRGPKSLCNACGIRQRKARRAMAAAAAAAASANGTVNVAAETTSKTVKCRVQKRSSNGNLKNNIKCKVSQGRKNKVCFEELRMILSKNSAFHHVDGDFPQDEKEAAILLMALSYGLVHG